MRVDPLHLNLIDHPPMAMTNEISTRFLARKMETSCRLAVLGAAILVAAIGCGRAQDSGANGSSPGFPELYDSEPESDTLVSPEVALASLRLPSGFSASLFAAEPEVQNPIAGCWDPQGRLWIAENYTYAERQQRFDLSLNDRVIVLEDTDGDGVADQRTVFSDQLKMLTGITVGRGGVWVMCPPQLLFIPDADGDLVPDGPPQVKLDGFTVARENYHNFANGLSWGPDSWLYGRCGASCAGEIGLPGSTDDQRVPIRGGMWRFHPESLGFETLTHGTTNPWGHDWNAFGDLFFINTVNGHLWHALPGAHFVRAHTLDINPYSYQLLDMHADHWHFDTGKSWTASRDGAANDFGGGHAHVGMFIYQEGVWPEQYHDRLMTVNMHGRRINQEVLRPNGSGYVGSHEPDFMLSDDVWFRGMDILPTPDGQALVLDWSDTGECHDSTGVHRRSGRIFKISFAAAPESSNPLRQKSIQQDPVALAKLQTSSSTWVTRRARELLRELALNSTDTSAAQDYLRELLHKSDMDVEMRLRALWALWALDAVDSPLLEQLLSDHSAPLRVWAVRLLSDDWRIDMSDGRRPAEVGVSPSSNTLALLNDLARSDPSPAVRLALASVLQRIPLADRAPLADGLLQHAGDAGDHNLPLMVWYGIAPLGDDHRQDLVKLAEKCQWPVTTRLIARRLAAGMDASPQELDRLLKLALKKSTQYQADVVRGMSQALAGWRKAEQPGAWPQLAEQLSAHEDDQVRGAVQGLRILFGDGRAVADLFAIAADKEQPLQLRTASLQTLVDARAPGLKSLCLNLLSERFLNTVAASGLAQESDPEIGKAILKAYRRFHPFERPQAISTLCSRVSWATSLLKAVQSGQLDRTEISPFQARQLASLQDPALDQLLLETWGQVRVSSEEKRRQMDTWRTNLTTDTLAAADKARGRALFDKTCAKCHQLFGAGGKLGPDLTGAQRSNLDYLLENIIDPSAVVTKEFRATILLLEDDRVLTGLVTESTDKTVTLATQLETHVIPRDEIAEQRLSSNSTMPDGLLDQLERDQIRDLIAYLQSQTQVP